MLREFLPAPLNIWPLWHHNSVHVIKQSYHSLFNSDFFRGQAGVMHGHRQNRLLVMVPFMRLHIQLFLTLLIASALLIAMLFAINSWTFSRGFASYVNQTRLYPLVTELAGAAPATAMAGAG